MKMARQMGLLLLACTLVAACNSTDDADGGQEIAGKNWQLDGLVVDQQAVVLPKSAGATLRFDGKGGVSGNTGCNSLGGEAKLLANGSLSFGPLLQTELACDEPRMTLESKFTSFLALASRWKVVNGVLHLQSADGRSSASFR
jgi:heat shock protein HslJ